MPKCLKEELVLMSSDEKTIIVMTKAITNTMMTATISCWIPVIVKYQKRAKILFIIAETGTLIAQKRHFCAEIRIFN